MNHLHIDLNLMTFIHVTFYLLKDEHFKIEQRF